MEFCEKLQLLRKEKNLSQEQLAELLVVPPVLVSRWENGSALPSPEILEMISSRFGIEEEELLEQKEKGNSSGKLARLSGWLNAGSFFALALPLFIWKSGTETAALRVLNYPEPVRYIYIFLMSLVFMYGSLQLMDLRRGRPFRELLQLPAMMLPGICAGCMLVGQQAYAGLLYFILTLLQMAVIQKFDAL